MKEYLLQYLAELARVYYISDLHNKSYTLKVYLALEKLSPDNYSLSEWEEAVEYILGQRGNTFDTPSSACQFLRHELEKDF